VFCDGSTHDLHEIANGVPQITNWLALIASGSNQIANGRVQTTCWIPQLANWKHKSPDGRVEPASGLIKLGVSEINR